MAAAGEEPKRGPHREAPKFKHISEFTEVQQSYGSCKEAYSDLGVNTCVKSHRARVFKSRDGVKLLYCHLYPECCWTAALVQNDGGWELRSSVDPTDAQHNQQCTTLKGTKGFDTLEQRRSLVQAFAQGALVWRTHVCSAARPELVSPNAPESASPKLPESAPQASSRRGRCLQEGKS